MSQAVSDRAQAVATLKPRARQLARRAFLANPRHALFHPIDTFRWWRAMSALAALAAPDKVAKMDPDHFRKLVQETGFEARAMAALAASRARESAPRTD